MEIDYNTTLFSIIVPVYKVEKYLHQCVDSLLAQDYTDYEIILVNDGSPDNCPQICDEYAAKSQQVKVIHKQNGGLSDARNKGVEASSGQYVTFVDSDDFWKDTNVLSGVAQVINAFHPDVIVSDFIKYYTDTNKYVYPSITCDLTYNGKTKIEILKYLYFCHADMKMSACQKFAKRELLTCHPFTKDLLSEDIDWTLKIYPQAKSICVYHKPYYCYRQQRDGSITNTASQRSFDCLIRIIEHWKNQIQLLNIPDEEKDIYMGYLAYQLTMAMIVYLKLSSETKAESIKRIRSNLLLFNSTLNYKTRRVKMLVRIVGVKGACYVLDAFIKIRRLLKKSV